MQEQIAVQKLLREKLLELKSRNPTYSLRSFARRLKINSGAVSGILSGKRRVSQKLAKRIADALMLDPQQRAELLGGFEPRGRHLQPSAKAAVDRYLMLTADQFRIISEWYHFALLALMKTEDFRPSPSWIRKRLGISQISAKGAIDRLKRLGMIREREDGLLERTAGAYRTTDDVADVSLRRAHSSNLELAQRSLERDPIELRDFSSITVAIDPSKLPLAKEMIRKFQDEFSAAVETPPRREVYKLCLQLFPLTLPQKQKKESQSL